MENRINNSPQDPDRMIHPDNKQPAGPKPVSSPVQQELAEHWGNCDAETLGSGQTPQDAISIRMSQWTRVSLNARVAVNQQHQDPGSHPIAQQHQDRVDTHLQKHQDPGGHPNCRNLLDTGIRVNTQLQEPVGC